MSYHVRAVENYPRAIGKSETLRIGPFMTAVLAHGDIAHSGIGLHHAGHSIDIGIAQHIGREARDAWRDVLRTKTLLAPSATVTAPDWSPITSMGWRGKEFVACDLFAGGVQIEPESESPRGSAALTTKENII